MKNRKTQQANIEKTVPFFFRVGLITSISMAIVAFEWSTPIIEEVIDPTEPWGPPIEIELAPITYPEQIKLELPKELEKVIEVKPEPVEPVKVDKPIERINQPANFNKVVKKMYIPEPIIIDPFVRVPEIDPQFPGGPKALREYLENNVKYPLAAKDIGLTGLVYVSFTVSSKGEIKDIVIEKDIGGGCGNETIRVIKNMPNWIPGKQGGLDVNVPVSMRLNFALN